MTQISVAQFGLDPVTGEMLMILKDGSTFRVAGTLEVPVPEPEE
jgi:hypothetical protein